MKTIKINNRTISEISKPFIVAEAGVNYYDIAKKKRIMKNPAASRRVSIAI